MIEKENKIFKKLKNQECINQGYYFDINSLSRLFNKKIEKVKDTVILININEKVDLNIAEKNFNKLIKMNTDKTGYEVSNNEIRIVDDLNDYTIPIVTQLELGKVLIENLKNKKNFPSKSVFYFLVDEDILTIKFHEYRETEGLWINDDLESYANPVAYYMYDNT